MGSGKSALQKDIDNARQLGEMIASNGWITLSGGMKSGVMGAVNEGAKKKNGLTIGILPNDIIEDHSENIDIPITLLYKSIKIFKKREPNVRI